jgi:hypothetical protein
MWQAAEVTGRSQQPSKHVHDSKPTTASLFPLVFQWSLTSDSTSAQALEPVSHRRIEQEH